MLRKRTNPIKDEEWNQKVTNAADSFWSAFQMTENGKVKSTLLLNSFCLCAVLIAVYAAAFVFFIDPLHALTADAPILIDNLAGSLVPSIIGTAVCGLTWMLFKEKRTLPMAYLWMLALAAACLITMLILLRDEPQATVLFLQFFVLFVPAPILLGGGLSLFLYNRYRKNRPPAAEEADFWKRQ